MELKIGEKLKSKNLDSFIVEIEFMFGDADGEETVKMVFSREKYDNEEYYKTLVHEFIESIQTAIKLDSKGRCGFDSTEEALEWYEFGIDRIWKGRNIIKVPINTPSYNWGKFCETYEYATLELKEYESVPEEFYYNIPRYCDGWYGSYESLKIYYIDKEGYKHNVEIIND